MILLAVLIALGSPVSADLVPAPHTLTRPAGAALMRTGGYRLERSGGKDSRPESFLRAALAARGMDATGRAAPLIALRMTPSSGASPQGYHLTVNREGIVITASSPVGLFYGVVTLIQWMDQGGDRAVIPPVEIVDAPDLAIRGVTIDFRYAGMTRDQIRRAIDRAAALKANLLVWWLQDRLSWTSHPELAGPGALTATEWGELVAYADARFIEMVPYVDAYGHGERYLDHPRWASLSRSEHGYWGGDDVQYCASHPESWRLFDDLTREAAAVFSNTHYFHIGMDEVGAQDDHLCPECRTAVRALAAKTGEAAPYPRARNRFVAQRLGEATARIAKLGRTTMFWDDAAVWIETLALGPGGIEAAPAGIIPFVWHYDADPARLQKALGRSGAARFQTVVATSSNNADNIERAIAATSAFPHVIGAVATIWEGDVAGFDRRWPGFTQALALGWNRGAAAVARAAAEALIPTGWAPLSGPSGWAPGNGESPPPGRTPDVPRAVRFAPPFASMKDWRAVWDGASRLNLAGRQTVRIRMRAADPAAVGALVIYFQSGDGWYKLPDLHPGPGWTDGECVLSTAATEGKPAGWQSVDGVRVSLIPGGTPRRSTHIDLEFPAE